MKEKNVIFDTNNQKMNSNTNTSNINNVDCFIFEKEYCSLYDELIDKCYPYNFFTPIFDKEKFNTANEIYETLTNNKDISPEDLIKIRNKAIEKLGIQISTKKLYNTLIKYFEPKKHISRTPYNSRLVATAVEYYKKIQNVKNDIFNLESIEQEASEFIAEVSLIMDKEKEIIDEQKRLESELKIKKKNELKNKKKIENRNKLIRICVSVFALIATISIIFIFSF